MTTISDSAFADQRVRAALDAVRSATGEAWVVGGTVRDVLLGRGLDDLDIVLAGDPEPVARAVARALSAPVFPLSEAFGAWRVVARDGTLQCDLTALQGDSIEDDLSRRDFTINAMAVALDGAPMLDPFNGRADLEARTLRVLGGPTVAESAYASDPLRPLRLARIATELGFTPDPDTERLTREAATELRRAAPERIFAELRRIIVAERVLAGLELADRLGLLAAILPELAGLHGVEQSHFHHLDVYGHTLEVLRCQLDIERSPGEVFGADLAPALEAILAEPLADELSRAGALRLAALVHDIGKPATRAVLPGGRVTFIGHDAVGDEIIGEISRRLRLSERLRAFVGAITRHHLVLGFMVHERPLTRAAVYRYLTTCSPVEVEVTILSCADRLATRGKNAEAAIAAHLEVARTLMAAALDWRRDGPPRPPIRGDRLASELGLAPGPELGRILAALSEASYTGEASSPEEAIELARKLAAEPAPSKAST